MIDVKKERTQLAITQKRLAHAAGVDARTVRKLERGETVSLETRHAVYTALGLSLDRIEAAIKPPSIFETPEAKLNSARIMAGASVFYAAAVTYLAEVVSRHQDTIAGVEVSFWVLACLIGTVIHFVMATKDLKAYYAVKRSPQFATKTMMRKVFPFGVAMLMPSLFCTPPIGEAILMTLIVGIAAIWLTLLAALNEWLDQSGERTPATGR